MPAVTSAKKAHNLFFLSSVSLFLIECQLLNCDHLFGSRTITVLYYCKGNIDFPLDNICRLLEELQVSFQQEFRLYQTYWQDVPGKLYSLIPPVGLTEPSISKDFLSFVFCRRNEQNCTCSVYSTYVPGSGCGDNMLTNLAEHVCTFSQLAFLRGQCKINTV